MKKALMIASVASMIDKFNMNNITILEEQGYKVDVAANFKQGSITSQERVEEFIGELKESGREVYHIDVPRSIFKVKDILNSYKEVKKLCNDNQYDIVHCHSPIGGVIARFAARVHRKSGTKVIYTAHGFHFYQGAPKKNWLLYYPVELLCSRFTDVLITINQEDYTLAKKKMHAKHIVYVPGIGVDTGKFCIDHTKDSEKRKELSLNDEDAVILSVGQVSERKNHEVIVRALAKLGGGNVKYVIGGFGEREEYLRDLAKELGVQDQLFILGYRSDVAELLNIADIYAFPSLQEGLPVALMEAMSVGKAVVCSSIRGNTDLIENGCGGFLVAPRDADGFAEAIKKILQDENLKEKMGRINRETIRHFDMAAVDREMEKIYSDKWEKACIS